MCGSTIFVQLWSDTLWPQRFARLAKYLPFLPVFGGGTSLFQPVYVGDLARLVEILSRKPDVGQKLFEGKVIEAGGPQSMVFF
jgi:uncharacterized protein YbjT (DUF2867 family)